jgi:DNA-binding transcriptional regulator LsrR (DeoR family)
MQKRQTLEAEDSARIAAWLENFFKPSRMDCFMSQTQNMANVLKRTPRAAHPQVRVTRISGGHAFYRHAFFQPEDGSKVSREKGRFM